MPAAGPIAVFALLFAARDLEIGAGAQTELRVGQAPLVAGESPSTFMAALLTPAASLGLTSAEGEGWLRYAPRLLWRDPNPNHQLRPLILHLFGADHLVRPSRRTEWGLRAVGSFGEVDYASLGQILPGQAALTASTRILVLEGVTELSWRASRLTLMQASLSLRHWRALDAAMGPTTGTGVAAPLLPTQTRLSFDPRVSHAFSRRDTLVLRVVVAGDMVPGSHTDASLSSISGSSAVVCAPQLAWRSDLNRQNQMELHAGVVIAHLFGGSGTGQSFVPFAPIGGLRLASLLHRSRDLNLRSDLSGVVSWYLDPVLGTGLPRGEGGARIDASWGRRWSAELNGTFTTNLTRHPLAGDPDETLVTARLPVRFQASRNCLLEAGARYSERAPHLLQAGFAWRARESFVYLTLNVVDRVGLLSAGPSHKR